MSMRPLPRARAGFTLVEVMVVAVLFGILIGSLGRVLQSQSAFTRLSLGLVSGSAQSREGAVQLIEEIRDISPSDGDLLSFDSQNVTFRRTNAVAIACHGVQDGTPLFQTVAGTFTVGDSAQVFVDGDSLSMTDDRYQLTTYAGSSGSSGCGGGASGWTASWAPAVVNTAIGRGALVRTFVDVTYHLRTINGTKQYLYRNDGVTDAIVAGPLQAPGALFTFYDASAAVTTIPSAARLLVITLPGAAGSANPLRMNEPTVRVVSPYMVSFRGDLPVAATQSSSPSPSTAWWTTAKSR
jgi:prepilin-type N-terminal cleavage/methylation domain-containing protein